MLQSLSLSLLRRSLRSGLVSHKICNRPELSDCRTSDFGLQFATAKARWTQENNFRVNILAITCVIWTGSNKAEAGQRRSNAFQRPAMCCNVPKAGISQSFSGTKINNLGRVYATDINIPDGSLFLICCSKISSSSSIDLKRVEIFTKALSRPQPTTRTS